MSILLLDIRFGLRQLWKHPGFAVTAIFSLALGIAATVTVFSVLYSVLLHPFPYRDAERIVEFNFRDKLDIEETPHIYREQIDQLRAARSIQDVVEMDEQNLPDTTFDIPLDTDVVSLSGNAFPFFGVPAMVGRTFLPSDDPPGRAPEPVAVLSFQYWNRRFNGNPAIVGQAVRLGDRSYTILGVMPRNFTWWDTDLYVPLDTTDTSVSSYMTVLRVKPGYTKTQAAAEIQPILQEMLREHPLLEQTSVEVHSIGERFQRSLGGAIYMVFGGVLLLLVIGCLNVSILLLARAAARQQEIAVRAAVGANSQRIVRQLLTESFLLGLVGAALGVIVAYQATKYATTLLPWQLFPNGLDIPVNVPVFLFSGCLAVATSVIFGIIPALELANPDIREILQTSSRKVSGSVTGKWLYFALIAGQLAIAMLLLSVAIETAENFRFLLHTDLGYDPSHLADFSIPIHTSSYATWEARSNYLRLLRDRVAQTPGVSSASLGLIGPPYSDWDFRGEVAGHTSNSQTVNVNFADSEFFHALGISLLQGRLWDETETSLGARLAVVNKAFAKRYFPNGDALGHMVRVPELKNHPPAVIAVAGSNDWTPIIGIVGDARNNGLDDRAKPEIYFPYSLYMIDWVQIFVRSQGDPMTLETAVRRQVASVNPGQQISSPVVSMSGRIQQQPEWARAHLVAVLSGIFSALALVLAGVGLYSVVSYGVAVRVPEFGVRLAFGAQRRHILEDVLLRSGLSVAVGLLLGIGLNYALHKLGSHWGVLTTFDPKIAVVSGCILVLVALLACMIPALRASLMEPMKALRTE